MPETMTSTATTRDVPVVPDLRIRYETQPPEGPAHTVYRVVPSEPEARDRDRD